MVDGKKDTALGLGERLRSARKARALTLEQAAFTLRLEEQVLRALEDERYEVLGAAVFVRGHLKAYAKLLGLAEDTVLSAYRAADPASAAPPKVTREIEKPLTTTPGPATIFAAIVFAIAAMLLLYLLSTGGGESVQPAFEDTVVPAAAPVIQIVPDLRMLQPVPELPVAGSPGTAPVVTPAPAAATSPAGPAATAPAAESAPLLPEAGVE